MMKNKLILIIFVLILVLPICAETIRETRTIETFPFIENFESVTLPAFPTGWTVEDTNADGITWDSRAINGWSEPYAVACDYSFTEPMNDWFFTPSLHLINGVTYRIIFSYKCEYAEYPEKLEIKWGEAPNSASMLSDAIFSNTNIVNGAFQEVTVAFSVTPQGRDGRAFYNIGWHGFSDTYQWTLWVDNITIEEMPSDPVFFTDTSSYYFGNQQIFYDSHPKNITISNTGGGILALTSCSLVGSDSTQFELIDLNTYPDSIGVYSSSQVGIRFHPQSIGAKSVTLQYLENGTIVHNIPITGIGVDNTITSFPFNEDFETGGLPTNWIKLADGAGWRFGTNLGRGTYPIPAHTTYAAVNKNTSIFEYDPLPGRNDFLIPPPFDLTAGVGIPHFTFSSYFAYLMDNIGEHATVEYSIDGTNWNLLAEVPVYNSGWKFIDINLSAYQTCTCFFIRFHGDDMGIDHATGWAIDDVNLLFVDPTPTPPISINVTVTGTLVNLTWEPVLYVSGYRVYSAPDPHSNLWTEETGIITTTSWSGNTSLIRKFFRIGSVR